MIGKGAPPHDTGHRPMTDWTFSPLRPVSAKLA